MTRLATWLFFVLVLAAPSAAAGPMSFDVESASHSKFEGEIAGDGHWLHLGGRNYGNLTTAVGVSFRNEIIDVRRYEYVVEIVRGFDPYPTLLRMPPRNVSYSQESLQVTHFSLSTMPTLSAVAVTLEAFSVTSPAQELRITGRTNRPVVYGTDDLPEGGRHFLDDEVGHTTLPGRYLRIDLPSWQANGSGRFHAYWMNTTATAMTSDGPRELASHIYNEPHPLDARLQLRRISWYEVFASDAQVHVEYHRDRTSKDLFADRLFFGEYQNPVVARLSLDSVDRIGDGFNGSADPENGSLWLDGMFRLAATPVGAGRNYVLSVNGEVRQHALGGREPVASPLLTTAPTLLALGAVAAILARVAFSIYPFYTKLKKDRLLDVQARDTLYRLIQQTPGINFLALHGQVKNLDGTAPIAFGALAYHLSQMERFHLIVSKREGRYRRYFDVAANMGADAARVALLQTRPVPSIAREILQVPGLKQSSLHARLEGSLGITRQALAYHLRRLEAKDLVRREAEGRYFRYVPTERLHRLSGFLQPPQTGQDHDSVPGPSGAMA